MTGPKSYAVRQHLEAWQVTAENLEQVAGWCGGRPGWRRVEVPAGRRSTFEAEVGDWVLRGSAGFFVLADSWFREHYYREDPPPQVVRGCLTGEPLKITTRGARS